MNGTNKEKNDIEFPERECDTVPMNLEVVALLEL